jgi:hypothetical protein
VTVAPQRGAVVGEETPEDAEDAADVEDVEVVVRLYFKHSLLEDNSCHSRSATISFQEKEIRNSLL